MKDSDSCLNCIYLASGYTPGFGLCGYEPTIPACAYAPDKNRINLAFPHTECECWQQDPTKGPQ